MNYEPPQSALPAHKSLWPIALLLASSAACSEPPAPEVASVTNSSEGVVMAQAPQQGAVSNLPFSQGRSFASLDEYLEFRKKRGAYDVPWYRQIKPGLYELVSRRAPGAQRQIYSREELARKFGFQE